MKRIRCGYGLGDNLYLQSIVRALVAEGAELEVCTDYPQVFSQLGVKTAPFSRQADITAHYTLGKQRVGTTQFEDMCERAGVSVPELRLDWRVTNAPLVARVRAAAAGRPIVATMMPRDPMGRTDGFGAELLPELAAIQRAMRGHFTVLLGAGPARGALLADLDLSDQTTVLELLDVASIADGFIGYPSFFVPLAESFDRPGFYVWARRGLDSANDFIRTITPAKLLHKPAMHVVDCWPAEMIDEFAQGFHALVDARRGCRALSA